MLLKSALSPAESASENNPNCKLLGLSLMNPICRHDAAPLVSSIKRNRFRSHASPQRVIIVVSAPTARSKSLLANRAMYMLFIKHLVAMWDNSPVGAAFATASPAGCATTSGSLALSTKGVGAHSDLSLVVACEITKHGHRQSLANRSML